MYEKEVSKLKLYLPRVKWTLNKTVLFFKIFLFRTLIPASFLTVEAPLKIWFHLKHRCCTSFNILFVLKCYLWDEFSVSEAKKIKRMTFVMMSMKGSAFDNPVFCQNLRIRKYRKLTLISLNFAKTTSSFSALHMSWFRFWFLNFKF